MASTASSKEDGRLIFEKVEDMERRLLTLFSGIPRDISLADELIAERQAKAKRENEA